MPSPILRAYGVVKSRDTLFSTIIATITAPIHKLLVLAGFQQIPFDMEHHPFIAPRRGQDVRSPCPALNTMANHGYLPHNGRDIGPLQLIRALMQCFGISTFLATFLACGSLLLIGQWRFISLYDLCRHNGIEHSASLARADVRYHGNPSDTDEYAPPDLCKDLWHKLEQDSADGFSLTVEDIARARVRRERETKVPIDPVHAHIARGEIGLVLDIFGGPDRRLSIDMLRRWWSTEEFPKGWHPTRKQGSLGPGTPVNWCTPQWKRLKKTETNEKN